MTATLTGTRIMRRTLLGVGLSCALAVSLTACGSRSSKTSGGGSPSGPASSPMASMSMPMSSMPTGGGSQASGTATVDIKNFAFSPMDLTVTRGTKVTWKFEDSAQHTVKADDGSFTSPALSNGQTYSYTFTKTGTFKYICSIHQYMTATVTVK
ncbi:MAG: blue (type 1) copper domain protein [Mycobacterium sp.]|nr:blue (type 1) copper domain protein [Mycobacterium sp.]